MQAERPCARAFLDAAAAASGGGIWAKMNVAGCEERERGTPETKKAAPSWRARGAHRDRLLNLWPTTQEDRALLRCADLHHCSLRQAFACPVFAIWRSFGRLSNLGHVFPRKKGKAASLGHIVPGRLSIALLDPENGAGEGRINRPFGGRVLRRMSAVRARPGAGAGRGRRAGRAAFRSKRPERRSASGVWSSSLDPHLSRAPCRGAPFLLCSDRSSPRIAAVPRR